MTGKPDRRYSLPAILLHWAMALVLVAQFALGFVMADLEDQRRAFELIQWHKTLGCLLLALVVLRIGWRFTHRPPQHPADLAPAYGRAADAAHGALYALMLALPLTGWALVSASVLAIPTVLLGAVVVPNLPVAVSETSERLWGAIHGTLAYAGASLVGLHVAAAIWHEMTLDRPFLIRMLRSAGRKPE